MSWGELNNKHKFNKVARITEFSDALVCVLWANVFMLL